MSSCNSEVYIQTRVTSKLKPPYHSIYLGAPCQAICWRSSKSVRRLKAARVTDTTPTPMAKGPDIMEGIATPHILSSIIPRMPTKKPTVARLTAVRKPSLTSMILARKAASRAKRVPKVPHSAWMTTPGHTVSSMADVPPRATPLSPAYTGALYGDQSGLKAVTIASTRAPMPAPLVMPSTAEAAMAPLYSCAQVYAAKPVVMSRRSAERSTVPVTVISLSLSRRTGGGEE
mmetsp:Transcript_8289/g.23798  ORF Transcript_8289/g.23798 Transcript_8289/m.23798 type:complete len:231 (+) Transcript_8289:51-743(+)